MNDHLPISAPRITSPAYYPKWSLWMLSLLVLVCHGMLLLNDGVYWDGLTLYGHYLNNDVDSLLGKFRDAGNPSSGYFHLAFWHAPDMLFAYRLVTFSSILISTLLVFLLAQRVSILTARERWFIAAMFCCYSAFQANVEIIITVSRMAYALFFLAAYLTVHAFESEGVKATVLRISALVLFAISFRVNSLLLLYCLLLAGFLSFRQGFWSMMKLQVMTRYADYLLLPFAYLAVTRMLWDRQHEYANYNQLLFAPKQWVLDFLQSVHNSILMQFYNAWLLITHRPWVAAGLLVLAIAADVYLTARKRSHPEAAMPETDGTKGALRGTVWIVVFAVAGFVTALFPYLLVGKFPSVAGWSTRHALLLSLPVAVGMVAVGRAVGYIFSKKLAPHILRVSAWVLIAAFTLFTCKIYLEWQVRWIKDSSFIVNLRALPKEQTDKVNILVMTADKFIAGYEFYRFYEYAALFKLAWGNESKIGFHSSATHDAEWVMKNLPPRRFLLTDFNPDGCRANVTISQKYPEMGRLQLAGKYWVTKWFFPSELESFLADVSIVGMSDMVCPETSAAANLQKGAS